jgi:hypothetical protein
MDGFVRPVPLVKEESINNLLILPPFKMANLAKFSI